MFIGSIVLLFSVMFPVAAEAAQFTSLGGGTAVGGSFHDRITGMAVDSAKNVYVVGTTISSNFPTTPGAYDVSMSTGDTDVFVAKFSPDLSTLLGSTYVGGSSFEQSGSIKVGANGDVYVTGQTTSANFPVTSGAYDTTFSGALNSTSDVFVTRLSSDLKLVKSATLLGGTATEYEPSLALDSSNNVYLTGTTDSSDFPVTAGSFKTVSGPSASYVSKLSPTLNALLGSGYLHNTKTHGIVLDSLGNVFVAGVSSGNIGVVMSGYDITFAGNGDGLVVKLSSSLASVLKATYLGGAGIDELRAIAVDTANNIYVGGYAENGYPTTAGAYDITANGMSDSVVTKLPNTLGSLSASTFLGGAESEIVSSISLDGSNNVFVTGDTGSTNFPITSGAFGSNLSGTRNAFVANFTPALNTLAGSTHLGGPSGSALTNSYGFATVFGQSGALYIAGQVGGYMFPATTGYDTTTNGDGDGFIVYFAGATANPPTPISYTPSLKPSVPFVELGNTFSASVNIALPTKFSSEFVRSNGAVISVSPLAVQKTAVNKTTLLYGTNGLTPDTYVIRIVSTEGKLLAQSTSITINPKKVVYQLTVDTPQVVKGDLLTVKINPGLYAYEQIKSGAYKIRFLNGSGKLVSISPTTMTPGDGFSIFLTATYPTRSLGIGDYVVQLYDVKGKTILADNRFSVVGLVNTVPQETVISNPTVTIPPTESIVSTPSQPTDVAPVIVTPRPKPVAVPSDTRPTLPNSTPTTIQKTMPTGENSPSAGRQSSPTPRYR